MIIKNGLLSRNMVIKYKMKFNDISDKEIQEKREEKKIHDYASTYLNPKNAAASNAVIENLANVNIEKFLDMKKVFAH